MTIKVAVIGTAGRNSDFAKLSKELYLEMYKDCKRRIDSWKDMGELELVSGGAAWADHLAVILFNFGRVDRLVLYLPAEWEDGSFKETLSSRYPGNIANYYHRRFSDKIYGDSFRTLEAIQRAIDKGAEIVVNKKGFKARNLQVADSDIILAYTFGEGSVPKDGGTLHTWQSSSSEIKVHVPISTLGD